MNHRASRQQGMTLISFMVLFIMVGFYILLGLKMLPIYIEHYKVKTTLNNLKTEPGLVEKSPREIMSLLQKRWDINSIDRIKVDNSLSVEKSGESIIIDLDYEVEQPIISNVSALVKFKETYTMGGSN